MGAYFGITTEDEEAFTCFQATEKEEDHVTLDMSQELVSPPDNPVFSSCTSLKGEAKWKSKRIGGEEELLVIYELAEGHLICIDGEDLFAKECGEPEGSQLLVIDFTTMGSRDTVILKHLPKGIELRIRGRDLVVHTFKQ